MLITTDEQVLYLPTSCPPSSPSACYWVRQLPSRGRDIKTIHSQPSTNYTVILIIIIPLLNVSNSVSCSALLWASLTYNPPVWFRCDGFTTELFLSAFCDLFSVAQSEATSQVTLCSHVLAWCHVIRYLDHQIEIYREPHHSFNLCSTKDNWMSEVWGPSIAL